MNSKRAIYIVAAIIFTAVVGIVAAKNNMKTTLPPAASASSIAATPNAVTIANYEFKPTPVTVKVGTTVTWTNSDIARHSIVSDDPQSQFAPHGDLINQDGKYTFTFTKPGTYKYHCEPHPYMHGTVVVTQ